MGEKKDATGAWPSSALLGSAPCMGMPQPSLAAYEHIAELAAECTEEKDLLEARIAALVDDFAQGLGDKREDFLDFLKVYTKLVLE